MNYYMIPVTDGDTSKCINSIRSIDPHAKIIYLANHDISQMFRIPFIEKYENKAIMLTTKILLHKNLDFDLLNNQPFIHDNDLNLFLIDCSHEYFKVEYSSSKLVKTDLRNDIKNMINIEDQLYNYCSILQKDKKDPVYLGDVDKPAKIEFDGAWKVRG